jgi:phage gp29-like protein
MANVNESLQYLKNLNRKTLDVWQNARRVANLNTLYPNQWPIKYSLIDVYEEILKDGHLKGIVENRKNKVIGEEWSLIDENGNPDPVAKRLLNKKWFNDWMNYTLESVLFGYSCIEFNTVDGEVKSVELIERRCVIPEYNAIHRNPYNGQTSIDNVNVFDIDAFPDIMLIDQKHLGLLEGAVPSVVRKRYALAAWAEHTEIFCLNFLWGKTDLNDPIKKNNMFQQLEEAGRNRIAITGLDEELQVLEQSASDAFNIYDRLIARDNSELSKLIGGQTLTSDQGSSYAQANVHKDTSTELAERDLQWTADIVNDMLIPFLIKNYNYPLEGLTFEMNLARRSSVSDRVAIFNALKSEYEMTPRQIQELFGIEVTPKLTALPNLPDTPPTEENLTNDQI